MLGFQNIGNPCDVDGDRGRPLHDRFSWPERTSTAVDVLRTVADTFAAVDAERLQVTALDSASQRDLHRAC